MKMKAALLVIDMQNEFTIMELKERTYGTQYLNLDDLKSLLISSLVEGRN